MLTIALVPMLALHIGLPLQSRPDSPRARVEWENEDVRVARVVLAPGERVSVDSPSGVVIVYLTAGLDGRMPPAEAAWQPAGSLDMENRGRARFEAIVVQFKRTVPAASAGAAGQPYGAAMSRAPIAGWAGYGYGLIDYTYRDRVRSETLVNGPTLTVTKVREPGSMYLDPLRVDPAPRVVVYLRGGYAWPDATHYRWTRMDTDRGAETPRYGYAAARVHRGDVRVLPGDTPYTLSNAGSDAAEFVVIAQK